MINFLIGLGIGVVGLLIYIFISNYKNLRLIISDLLAFFGFLNKWVRKKSVESRYQNILNGAVNSYNESLEDNILPKCEIRWVDKETEETFLEDGKAIVCLKFHKRNQDLNFYNATYSFTSTALIPITRNFIKVISQKAIDLNLTKVFIKNYNRRALHIFNHKYNSEEEDVKEAFVKFEETEKRGLFSNILIPELHYLGDNLATTTPTKKIEEEIENFFDWFYDLATRDKEERTSLNFQSQHLRVGVILVANLETYDAYGIEAYTKWAEKYATENYGAVYLLARGQRRAAILKEVVQDLIINKGFDQINKRVSFFEIDDTNEKIDVYFYCLKPNIGEIQFNAWEKIKSAFKINEEVSGIIIAVEIDQITVNVYGLEFPISKEKLSSKEIPDLQKFFWSEQELVLRIESFNEDDCLALFSNVGTETDPSILIDTTLQNNKIIDVEVKRVQFDREGKERGLITYFEAIKRNVFIPKRQCSYSRFIRLEKEFNSGDKLKVVLHGFSMQFANYHGEIEGLSNPLTDFHKYSEGKKFKAVVQEITDNYITTEIRAGLECRIYRSELSWDGKTTTEEFEIGDELEVLIIKNDFKRFILSGSIKRVETSKEETFFNQIDGKKVKGRVKKIYEGIGLLFAHEDNGEEGFVYIRELMWGFCSDIGSNFPLESEINVVPISFDYHRNQIEYSIKAGYVNKFDEVEKNISRGTEVNGSIIKYFTGIARVELRHSGYKVQGYIHKSEISNIAYIENEDIEKFLPLNTEFTFRVKRKDKRNKIIELSRKEVVSSDFDNMEYGDIISVRIAKISNKCAYFYNNEIEGVITENFNSLTEGSTHEIYKITSEEFSV